MEYMPIVKGKGYKYVVIAITCLASIVSETARGMLSVTCAVQVATSTVTNTLHLSRIHNMMISKKKYNVCNLLKIVVSVLQKNQLNHCVEFLTDRHSLLKVQQLPQLHLTTLQV